jgi:hypothetical protein
VRRALAVTAVVLLVAAAIIFMAVIASGTWGGT